MAQANRSRIWQSGADGLAGGGIHLRALGHRQSARTAPTAFSSASETGDLSVHARRPVAGGHVRSEAAPQQGQWQAVAETLPRADEEVTGLAVEVLEARRVGTGGQR